MTNLDGNGEVYQAVEPAAPTPERSPLRWLWWLIGLLVIAGIIWLIVRACSTDEVVTAPAVDPIATVQLDCAGTPVTAAVFSDHVVATIDGTQFTLPSATAASGSRYYADGLTLWEAHDSWQLIHNEDTADAEWIDCTTN